jgi:hypothetical protein
MRGGHNAISSSRERRSNIRALLALMLVGECGNPR